MGTFYVERSTILEFLHRLDGAFAQPGRLYLLGETTQVVEGWYQQTKRLDFAAEIAPARCTEFDKAVTNLQNQLGIDIYQEAPGDIIPLPAGYEARARPFDNGHNGKLQFYHFDPYSVAFRLITRGDEPDYRTVLAYLEHGWLTVDEMNRLLADLLPQFTNETIQQDPAEFRRKYRGLMQMWRARESKGTKVPEEVPSVT
jgi:hypothetical protein